MKVGRGKGRIDYSGQMGDIGHLVGGSIPEHRLHERIRCEYASRDQHPLPNHEGIVVPKGWHFPMTVDPDLFVDTVRDWWQRKVAKQTI